jgi:hypothetical protein
MSDNEVSEMWRAVREHKQKKKRLLLQMMKSKQTLEMVGSIKKIKDLM